MQQRANTDLSKTLVFLRQRQSPNLRDSGLSTLGRGEIAFRQHEAQLNEYKRTSEDCADDAVSFTEM